MCFVNKIPPVLTQIKSSPFIKITSLFPMGGGGKDSKSFNRNLIKKLKTLVKFLSFLLFGQDPCIWWVGWFGMFNTHMEHAAILEYTSNQPLRLLFFSTRAMSFTTGSLRVRSRSMLRCHAQVLLVPFERHATICTHWSSGHADNPPFNPPSLPTAVLFTLYFRW